jgi:tetratricopeptide (TPR) repeat protein
MLQPPSKTDNQSYGAPTDPIAPLRLALRNRYDIEREIGQGAFATVYLARDLKHERKVALKVLNADPTSEMGELRFIREIRMLAGLQHPNILPLHDSGHVEALLYYVMPYVSGETLRARIQRERRLSIDAACNIAREAADGLGYAHTQGIIHRDVKPENILLSGSHPILADFGIARAIDLGGVRQLTRTGANSPGTPAYMSPEQVLGEGVLDGRSDTYSLGCVLYEMLAGKAPFAGKEGFVKRFTEPAPSVRLVRPEVPEWMDVAIATALARRPADRFPTADDMVRALGGPRSAAVLVSGTAGETAIDHFARPEPPARPAGNETDAAPRMPADLLRKVVSRSVSAVSRHAKLTVCVGAAVLLIAVGVTTTLGARLSTVLGVSPAFDEARIAVLPLGGSAQQASRNRLAESLYSALTDWQGLSIASDEGVRGAVAELGYPLSAESAANIARRVRAGRFVWGRVSSGDSPNARIELYRVGSASPIRSALVTASQSDASIAQAARSLLAVPNRPASADGGDGRTKSFEAWTEYGKGHVALQNGNLGAAEGDFRAAIAADGAFGPAHAWLAQTVAWKTPVVPLDWRDEAAAALRSASGLSDEDKQIAVALTYLAAKQFPEACAVYSSMTGSDSASFAGLYGSGECRALDSLVVPSTASVSGWAFRTRYADAANFYIRALSLNPGAHSILSFEQLQELLPTSMTKTRRGYNAAREEFAAFPALVGNYPVFVPYRLADFARLSARQTNPPQLAAIARNLEVLRDFALEWTRTDPTSSAGYRALAKVLETRGEISNARTSPMSARQAIRRARDLARTRRDSLTAGADEAWLLFKESNFPAARALSDSLLGSVHSSTADEAETVIGLAALTGKISKVAEYSTRLDYASALSNLPIPVTDAAAAFFAFSALGVCGDETLRLERELDAEISHYVAEDKQAQIAGRVKARPLSMLGPCSRGASSLRIPLTNNSIMRMEQALARSDNATLTSLLAPIVETGKTQRPGDVALDFTYLVAWLRAERGDTLGATLQLDRLLGSLPSIDPNSLREPASAASVVRAMALRAEIAAAKKDFIISRKWANAVLQLWGGADPPLRPVLSRLHALSTLPN